MGVGRGASPPNRRDEVALRTYCIKNVKFKMIKIKIGCHYMGCFYYNENLNWAAGWTYLV